VVLGYFYPKILHIYCAFKTLKDDQTDYWERITLPTKFLFSE